ncbi:hypothetical protein DFH06DRAFT_1125397 [Mycena polygramma]|nr:hypothetical protein DFH06DRAFT_1125397 [Mycena polygramma]
MTSGDATMSRERVELTLRNMLKSPLEGRLRASDGHPGGWVFTKIFSVSQHPQAIYEIPVQASNVGSTPTEAGGVLLCSNLSTQDSIDNGPGLFSALFKATVLISVHSSCNKPLLIVVVWAWVQLPPRAFFRTGQFFLLAILPAWDPLMISRCPVLSVVWFSQLICVEPSSILAITHFQLPWFAYVPVWAVWVRIPPRAWVVYIKDPFVSFLLGQLAFAHVVLSQSEGSGFLIAATGTSSMSSRGERLKYTLRIEQLGCEVLRIFLFCLFLDHKTAGYSPDSLLGTEKHWKNNREAQNRAATYHMGVMHVEWDKLPEVQGRPLWIAVITHVCYFPTLPDKPIPYQPENPTDASPESSIARALLALALAGSSSSSHTSSHTHATAAALNKKPGPTSLVGQPSSAAALLLLPGLTKLGHYLHFQTRYIPFKPGTFTLNPVHCVRHVPGLLKGRYILPTRNLIAVMVPNDLRESSSYIVRWFRVKPVNVAHYAAHCAHWDSVSSACVLCAPMLTQRERILSGRLRRARRETRESACERQGEVSLSTPAERIDLSATDCATAERCESESTHLEFLLHSWALTGVAIRLILRSWCRVHLLALKVPCGSRAPAHGEVRPWIGLRARVAWGQKNSAVRVGVHRTREIVDGRLGSRAGLGLRKESPASGATHPRGWRESAVEDAVQRDGAPEYLRWRRWWEPLCRYTVHSNKESAGFDLKPGTLCKMYRVWLICTGFENTRVWMRVYRDFVRDWLAFAMPNRACRHCAPPEGETPDGLEGLLSGECELGSSSGVSVDGKAGARRKGISFLNCSSLTSYLVLLIGATPPDRRRQEHSERIGSGAACTHDFLRLLIILILASSNPFFPVVGRTVGFTWSTWGSGVQCSMGQMHW